MPIKEDRCISTIEEKLEKDGFDLEQAPYMKKLVKIIVDNILVEVKKNGEVNVPAKGLVAPPNGGSVSGEATGTIS